MGEEGLRVWSRVPIVSATTASARKEKFTADTRATMPMPVDLGRPIAMAAWKESIATATTADASTVMASQKFTGDSASFDGMKFYSVESTPNNLSQKFTGDIMELYIKQTRHDRPQVLKKDKLDKWRIKRNTCAAIVSQFVIAKLVDSVLEFGTDKRHSDLRVDKIVH